MMMMKIKMAITWPIYKIAASSYLFCIVVDLDNNCVDIFLGGGRICRPIFFNLRVYFIIP